MNYQTFFIGDYQQAYDRRIGNFAAYDNKPVTPGQIKAHARRTARGGMTWVRSGQRKVFNPLKKTLRGAANKLPGAVESAGNLAGRAEGFIGRNAARGYGMARTGALKARNMATGAGVNVLKAASRRPGVALGLAAAGGAAAVVGYKRRRDR